MWCNVSLKIHYTASPDTRVSHSSDLLVETRQVSPTSDTLFWNPYDHSVCYKACIAVAILQHTVALLRFFHGCKPLKNTSVKPSEKKKEIDHVEFIPTEEDKEFVRHLQKDLEVTDRPFLKAAESLGITEDQIFAEACTL